MQKLLCICINNFNYYMITVNFMQKDHCILTFEQSVVR